MKELKDKRDRVGGDTFFATDETEMLGGGRFKTHLVGFDAHDLGQTGLHRLDMRVELGLLRTDRDIAVTEFVAGLADHLHHTMKEDLRVDSLVFVAFGVGEMITDITHRRGTENGVAERVNNDIRVRMTQQTFGIGHFNPP